MLETCALLDFFRNIHFTIYGETSIVLYDPYRLYVFESPGLYYLPMLVMLVVVSILLIHAYVEFTLKIFSFINSLIFKLVLTFVSHFTGRVRHPGSKLLSVVNEMAISGSVRSLPPDMLSKSIVSMLNEQGELLGTGFFTTYNKNLYVISAAHVVSHTTKFYCKFGTEIIYSTSKILVNAPQDLLIFKVQKPKSHHNSLKIAKDYIEGSFVKMVGYYRESDNIYALSQTTGNVLATEGLFRLSHNCSTTPGSSGAPIICGVEVVGYHLSADVLAHKNYAGKCSNIVKMLQAVRLETPSGQEEAYIYELVQYMYESENGDYYQSSKAGREELKAIIAQERENFRHGDPTYDFDNKDEDNDSYYDSDDNRSISDRSVDSDYKKWDKYDVDNDNSIYDLEERKQKYSDFTFAGFEGDERDDAKSFADSERKYAASVSNAPIQSKSQSRSASGHKGMVTLNPRGSKKTTQNESTSGPKNTWNESTMSNLNHLYEVFGQANIDNILSQYVFPDVDHEQITKSYIAYYNFRKDLHKDLKLHPSLSPFKGLNKPVLFGQSRELDSVMAPFMEALRPYIPKYSLPSSFEEAVKSIERNEWNLQSFYGMLDDCANHPTVGSFFMAKGYDKCISLMVTRITSAMDDFHAKGILDPLFTEVRFVVKEEPTKNAKILSGMVRLIAMFNVYQLFVARVMFRSFTKAISSPDNAFFAGDPLTYDYFKNFYSVDPKHKHNMSTDGTSYDWTQLSEQLLFNYYVRSAFVSNATLPTWWVHLVNFQIACYNSMAPYSFIKGKKQPILSIEGTPVKRSVSKHFLCPFGMMFSGSYETSSSNGIRTINSAVSILSQTNSSFTGLKVNGDDCFFKLSKFVDKDLYIRLQKEQFGSAIKVALGGDADFSSIQWKNGPHYTSHARTVVRACFKTYNYEDFLNIASVFSYTTYDGITGNPWRRLCKLTTGRDLPDEKSLRSMWKEGVTLDIVDPYVASPYGTLEANIRSRVRGSALRCDHFVVTNTSAPNNLLVLDDSDFYDPHIKCTICRRRVILEYHTDDPGITMYSLFCEDNNNALHQVLTAKSGGGVKPILLFPNERVMTAPLSVNVIPVGYRFAYATIPPDCERSSRFPRTMYGTNTDSFGVVYYSRDSCINPGFLDSKVSNITRFIRVKVDGIIYSSSLPELQSTKFLNNNNSTMPKRLSNNNVNKILNGSKDVVNFKDVLGPLVRSGRLTKDGANWLKSALDPFHDQQYENPRWPGYCSTATLSGKKRFSVVFDKPTTVTTDTWDLHITCNPYYAVGAFSSVKSSSCDVNSVNDPTCSADSGWGTFNLFSAVAANSGEIIYPSSSNAGFQTPVASYYNYPNVTPSLGLSGASRIVSIGYETRNTTAEIYRQGTLTLYSNPTSSTDGGGSLLMQKTAGTTSSNSALFYSGPLYRCALPPSNVGQATALYGQIKLLASEGGYIAVPFDGVSNDVVFPYSSPIYSQCTAVNSTGVSCNGLITGLSERFVPNGDPIFMGTQVGPAPDYNIQADNDASYSVRVGMSKSNFYPVHITQTGMYFTGLSAETTIDLSVCVNFEVAVDSRNPSLVAFASKVPAYDPFALMLYHRIRMGLPVGTKVADNASGDWWRAVASVLSDVLEIAAIPLGIISPAASSITVAASKALDLAAQKKIVEMRKQIKQDVKTVVSNTVANQQQSRKAKPVLLLKQA